MYSLVLDESGTHAGAPVVLVAGLAVHESDVQRLESAAHAVLERHMSPLGLDPYEFEAHAAELKTPRPARPRGGGKGTRPASHWLPIDGAVRLAVLNDLYNVISSFKGSSSDYPVRMFGAIIDRRNKTQPKAERMAYEHVLHCFEQMLSDVSERSGSTQRGIVLHDRRDGYDRTIQELTVKLQRSTGSRRIERLVHVPLFADSRMSRLIQIADFISYALWRHYSEGEIEHVNLLWPLVEGGERGELTGVIHKCPEFGAKECSCRPCTSRY